LFINILKKVLTNKIHGAIMTMLNERNKEYRQSR